MRKLDILSAMRRMRERQARKRDLINQVIEKAVNYTPASWTSSEIASVARVMLWNHKINISTYALNVRIMNHPAYHGRKSAAV